mgnify:CR=1 FL=1|jgi:hypothetical protein
MKIISPKQILITLLAMDGVLGVLYLITNGHPELGSFFNLAAENNLPTWYSSFQFFLVGLAAFYCSAAEKRSTSNSIYPWAWGSVGVLMLALSIDETMQIHEALIDNIMSGAAGENLRTYFGATHETDSLLWTVVFAPPMIVVGIGLMWFYFSVFKNITKLFGGALAALSLLALAAGLEYVEAKVLIEAKEGLMNQYHLLTFIEEMAEFLAATLFVWIHYSYAWHLQKNN